MSDEPEFIDGQILTFTRVAYSSLHGFGGPGTVFAEPGDEVVVIKTHTVLNTDILRYICMNVHGNTRKFSPYSLKWHTYPIELHE